MAVKKRKSKKNAANNPGGAVIDLEETEKEMDSLIGQLSDWSVIQSDWSIGYNLVQNCHKKVSIIIHPYFRGVHRRGSTVHVIVTQAAYMYIISIPYVLQMSPYLYICIYLSIYPL